MQINAEEVPQRLPSRCLQRCRRACQEPSRAESHRCGRAAGRLQALPAPPIASASPPKERVANPGERAGLGTCLGHQELPQRRCAKEGVGDAEPPLPCLAQGFLLARPCLSFQPQISGLGPLPIPATRGFQSSLGSVSAPARPHLSPPYLPRRRPRGRRREPRGARERRAAGAARGRPRWAGRAAREPRTRRAGRVRGTARARSRAPGPRRRRRRAAGRRSARGDPAWPGWRRPRRRTRGAGARGARGRRPGERAARGLAARGWAWREPRPTGADGERECADRAGGESQPHLRRGLLNLAGRGLRNPDGPGKLQATTARGEPAGAQLPPPLR